MPTIQLQINRMYVYTQEPVNVYVRTSKLHPRHLHPQSSTEVRERPKTQTPTFNPFHGKIHSPPTTGQEVQKGWLERKRAEPR